MRNFGMKTLLAAVTAALALTAFECESYDPDDNNLEITENVFSKCGERLFESNDTTKKELFEFSSNDLDIIVKHHCWSVPCDFTKVWERVWLEGRTIYVEEKADGGAVNCVCETDHQFTISNIPYGQYDIIIRNGGLEVYNGTYIHQNSFWPQPAN